MNTKTMQLAPGVRNPLSPRLEGWLPRVGRSVLSQNFKIDHLSPLAINILEIGVLIAEYR
jgi:hypothetical protein